MATQSNAPKLAPPAWMATFDAIEIEGNLLAGRVAEILSRQDHLVAGFTDPVTAVATMIIDRMGSAYARFDAPVEVGSIQDRTANTANTASGPLAQESICMRILRAVDVAEVQAVACFYRGAGSLPVSDGCWYEVLAD